MYKVKIKYDIEIEKNIDGSFDVSIDSENDDKVHKFTIHKLESKSIASAKVIERLKPMVFKKIVNAFNEEKNSVALC